MRLVLAFLLLLPALTVRAAEWRDYQVLLWQTPPPGSGAVLRALGITGAALLHPMQPDGQARMRQFQADGLRWYDENLATDFYAAYHRWHPDHPVTWLFDTVRARHRAAPDDLSVFNRTPSLSDPAWLDRIRTRLETIVREQAPYRPLFYNLGDETGIADLSAAWDFDLSAYSLGAMRDWLRGRYGTLDSLNRAWGTHFTAWDSVRPALTDAAIRSDAAVPSWMDFKAWMDTAFARAVRAGTEAVHRGDPQALAGLEGAQMPGWGGYDYGKLATAVDVMEIYDSGNAVEIARSLNPRLRVLTTSFASGPAERRRLWHELLLGGAGCIVWDENGEVLRADGKPGPRGKELAPLWRKLGSSLGARFLDATPEPGQVAILYSQASFRLTWLLDRRHEGGRWEDRDAEAENGDNAWRAATRRAARLLADLGAQARWITPAMLTGGMLAREGIRVLVLPHSIALSDAEVAALQAFAQSGGTLVADVEPGERDALGRPRAAPPKLPVRLPAFLRTEHTAPDGMARLLDQAGVQPTLRVLGSDGRMADGLDIRLFRSGKALIAGIQRTDDAQGERSVTVDVPKPYTVQIIDGRTSTQPVTRLAAQLDPVRPLLLVLSPPRD